MHIFPHLLHHSPRTPLPSANTGSLPRPPATELISVLLAKLVTLLADGLIRPLAATFPEELSPLSEAQTQSEVQTDSVANNLYRKAVILICGGRRRGVHALITCSPPHIPKAISTRREHRDVPDVYAVRTWESKTVIGLPLLEWPVLQAAAGARAVVPERRSHHAV